MEASGRFVAGEVVVVTFPFTKVPGDSDYADDYILCEITSKNYESRVAVELREADFDAGGLRMNSYVRPLVIFTLEKELIKKSVGHVHKRILRRTVKELSEYLASKAE